MIELFIISVLGIVLLSNDNGEKLVGGLGDGRKPSDFDQRQLRMGIKVEREHTKDPRVAREIAMDHLTEHKNYYDELKVAERKMKGPS
jgi:hypothetical protein